MNRDYESGYRAAMEHAAQKTALLHQQLEIMTKAMANMVSLQANPPIKMMAKKESYDAGYLAGVMSEREACANECEHTALRMGSEWMAKHCAQAIRARGKA